MSIQPPNYTQFPNQVLDQMHEMGNPEWRVVCAICRKTFGWQKLEDELSLSQFVELTGMTKPSVITGIEKAIEHGFIERRAHRQSFKYRLVVENLYQSEKTTSKKSLLVEAESSKEFLPEVVKEFDTQKKVKETSIKEKVLTAPKARGPNPNYELAKAISEVCHMNLEANQGRLLKEAATLSKATPTPTPNLVKQHYNGHTDAFWRATDWRGKKGYNPTPAQIRETWGQWIDQGGTVGALFADWTPEQVAAENERLNAHLRKDKA